MFSVSAQRAVYTADPPGQLYVLGHDGDLLGVDGAQLHDVHLHRLVQDHHGGNRAALRADLDPYGMSRTWGLL